MALDSGLLNQIANPPAPPNPLERYGRVLALKNALGEGQLQQQQIQQGQEALRGQQALDHVMQTAFTKDADGNLSINRDAVTNGLSSAGQGHRIPGVLKTFDEMDKAAAERKEALLKVKNLTDDYTAQGLIGIADHGYDPTTALGVLAHATESGVLPAQQAQQMAAQITANPTKENVQALIEPLLSKSPGYQKLADSRKTAQASVDSAAARKLTADTGASAAAAKLPGEKAKASQDIRSELAARLGAATSPEEYQKILGAAPFEVARDFAGKTPEQARRLGMTAEQQTQADQAKTNAGQTAAHQKVEEQQGAQRIGIAGAELALSQSKNKRDQDIYEQTYGTGSNEALRTVEPRLRVQATTQAQKAADEFVKAGAAERDMKTFLDLAKSGNKEAHAYLSPEGVLTLNTGRGVTRVNRQEIDAYAGAGSLFDNIASKVGKLTSGQSVPPAILKDIEQLHEQISKNSLATYNQKLAGINQNYRSSFKPVEATAATGATSATKTAVGGYQIGHKYGTLEYLGGDPNDKANWK